MGFCREWGERTNTVIAALIASALMLAALYYLRNGIIIMKKVSDTMPIRTAIDCWFLFSVALVSTWAFLYYAFVLDPLALLFLALSHGVSVLHHRLQKSYFINYMACHFAGMPTEELS
jgi:hypothetical protein